MDYLRTLQNLNSRVQAFWQDWQREESALQALDEIAFSENGNDILQRHLPDTSLELIGTPADGTLVFTAHGVREFFPALYALGDNAPAHWRKRIELFRQAIKNQDIGKFAIGMADFHLAVDDIGARLHVEHEMPVLELAFQRAIPADMADQAKHMAIIMLDHVLGEWNAAIKLGWVDFAGQADADFFPFAELPKRLAALWAELGRNGDYPPPEEWAYATAESGDSEEYDKLLFIRNQSANQLVGRADMCWQIVMHCDMGDEAVMEQAYALQDALEAEAIVHQQGIPTLVVTNLTQGVRSVYVMTADPQGLLKKAQALAERFAAIHAQCECGYEPDWSHYRF